MKLSRIIIFLLIMNFTMVYADELDDLNNEIAAIQYCESFNFVEIRELIIKHNHEENGSSMTRVFLKVTGQQNQSRVYYFDCDPLNSKDMTNFNTMLATLLEIKRSPAPVFKLIASGAAYKISGIEVISCPEAQ